MQRYLHVHPPTGPLLGLLCYLFFIVDPPAILMTKNFGKLSLQALCPERGMLDSWFLCLPCRKGAVRQIMAWP